MRLAEPTSEQAPDRAWTLYRRRQDQLKRMPHTRSRKASAGSATLPTEPRGWHLHPLERRDVMRAPLRQLSLFQACHRIRIETASIKRAGKADRLRHAHSNGGIA